MIESKFYFVAAVLALLPACATKVAGLPGPYLVPCCSEYDVDVNQVMGPQGIDCGTILTNSDDRAARRNKHEVMACARAAQAAGRAFAVSWVHSDGVSYTLDFAMFGAKGEKIVVQARIDCEGHVYSIGECAALTITDTGSMEGSGCQWNEEALLSRLKPADQAASER